MGVWLCVEITQLAVQIERVGQPAKKCSWQTDKRGLALEVQIQGVQTGFSRVYLVLHIASARLLPFSVFRASFAPCGTSGVVPPCTNSWSCCQN